MSKAVPVIPRKGPYLGLDGEIPKYWFGGDPFKTRLFDALSLVFPEGEKFFITCVRDYKDQIKDPKLAEEVKHFTFQEGQHSMVHRLYNEHLLKQGIDPGFVDKRFQRVFGNLRRFSPKWFTLASTAAIEHLTATFSHALLEGGEKWSEADPRLRAMFAWHCIEEFEHRSVAFDVMEKVAKVGYLGRTGVMVWVSFTFQMHIFAIMRRMLINDGFSARERKKIWSDGMKWLYGRDGFFTIALPTYLSFLKPGFHPEDTVAPGGYDRWLQEYEKTGDAMIAGDIAMGLGKAA
jgi:predicted metal-dependent hydrolase